MQSQMKGMREFQAELDTVEKGKAETRAKERSMLEDQLQRRNAEVAEERVKAKKAEESAKAAQDEAARAAAALTNAEVAASAARAAAAERAAAAAERETQLERQLEAKDAELNELHEAVSRAAKAREESRRASVADSDSQSVLETGDTPASKEADRIKPKELKELAKAPYTPSPQTHKLADSSGLHLEDAGEKP